MSSIAVKPDPQGWFGPALVVVAVLTLLRLILLAFDHTDLFVDEAQYWLWGQHLDFGYYSKPPLIGWLLRAVTDLAGSNAPFWIRMPGPLLHGATALILGALGARIAGRPVAIWSAVIYVTLPFVALGSVMISTDTVMAPFYAAALLFAHRTAESRHAVPALVAGAMAGLAFMAKYAAIYLIPGAVLAALSVPAWRPGWRNAVLMVLAFAVVISSNVIWNLTHDLATVSHTMDNVGWVRTGAMFNLSSMGGFLVSQFAVFGPLTMVALLIGYPGWRDPGKRALALMSLVPLVVVTAEALLDRAYANWAIAAYFPGTVLAAMVLAPMWRKIAVGVNLIVVVAIPVLSVLAPWPEWNGKPLLKRWIGRVALSEQILTLAQREGVPVLAENRDILADLHYTGRNSGVRIYAMRPRGRAASYYEQMESLPEGWRGKVLLVATRAPDCGAGPVAPIDALPAKGAWAGKGMAAYLVEGACADPEN